MNRRVAWVIFFFVSLVALLAAGLTLNPREVPSPLIGKPAPAFELPRLDAPDKTFSHKEMLGRVWIMNVWASWCPPCLIEHPVITDLAKSGIAPVVGLNYKDKREDALPWLRKNGDPYALSVFDAAGRIAIDYGVYGVPETYVIDQKGIIRYKHIGPVSPEVAEKKLKPLVKELQARG
ncbi:MAG TPA: DsbE family thiol:disulfide interchange protein [Burkholderiales bacterium]|nr:DsbE family thiol:disulfide interchange protein [Burkholderiales bacterium]